VHISIIQALSSHNNPDKALQMKKYMKNKFEFLGIQTPLRRSILKPYIKEFKQLSHTDQMDIIKKMFLGAEYREIQYLALDLCKYIILQANDIELIHILATHHSWWDSVDSLHSILGNYFRIFPDKRKPITQSWLKTQNIWLIRLLIDHQLNSKDSTDWEYLQDIILKTCHYDEFFIQSAIGWSLSEYSKIYPDIVVNFVHNHQLGTFATRRALEWIKKHPQI
jgi:3-methyladenine DNA glycosylase AlkD